MPEQVWLVLAASLSLLAAAFVFLGDFLRRARHPGSGRRLDEVLARHAAPQATDTPLQAAGRIPPWFERYLQRAGLRASPAIYLLLLAPAPAVFLLADLISGLYVGLAVTFVAYGFFLWSFLQWRIGRFRRQIVALLPGFLESISRILSVGCSLELAFRNASEESEEPLQGITRQVVQRTRAGQSLEDAMMQIADIYAIRELGFVASVFHLGIRYGGNANAVLERLSVTMRERRRSQQELQAMTAETRASAWILSALPVVVAMLTLASNPSYLLGMWIDPTGRKILLAALALQIAGMFLLFRMARLER